MFEDNQNPFPQQNPGDAPANDSPATGAPEPAQNPSEKARPETEDLSARYFNSPLDPYARRFTEPAPPVKKKKKRYWGIVAGLIAVYLLSLVAVGLLVKNGVFSRSDNAPSKETTVEENQTTDRKTTENAPLITKSGENSAAGDYSGEAIPARDLYAQNVKSVVYVSGTYSNGYQTGILAGSGFVIDAQNGYILTNEHVIQGCTDLIVSFQDGQTYNAILIAGDEINDVAVLKIEASGLRQVTIGSYDNLAVGDDIYVIGHPLQNQLSYTMTRGIVSGKDRVINTGEYSISTFQTDAAINSGNSGGPAFDNSGAVVGIASAKYAASGVEGVCFCIPIDDAIAIAEDLVKYGYVTGRANFGVTVSTSSGYSVSVDGFGRRVVTQAQPGAKIEAIASGSCAEKAGLKVGDIVTKLNDIKVESSTDLINAKNQFKAGDTVTLEVFRDEQFITLQVTLDEYKP